MPLGFLDFSLLQEDTGHSVKYRYPDKYRPLQEVPPQHAIRRPPLQKKVPRCQYRLLSPATPSRYAPSEQKKEGPEAKISPL